ncbi:MAG: class I SAM-dependent methyltransferase [Williamsia herbipolensis]|uniref:Ubiquinone/menaquinone biosynthesis C-methylase UbiE n=1 Tax=Williamsia serinedens TaxID=391736 RepID=A0ABT1H7D9_9NOCA|nr:class I SAM-dependent methyltransferase [Williamsia serinedens]MBE7159954.1 class I SAM-dependent methyltransferase [Williamsia herbipolensis]MCP2161693.1 Ubiquinone/menaquinone biosynthesis C-methylase UbiE [Williamsia serinedens]
MTDGPLHGDRALALSFGSEAESYEQHRPDFPPAMMDVVARLGHRVLDVGSGTGKAARALLDRGCSVLAVEPDVHMATIARRKHVVVEPGTFEEWDPRGRMFDLVTFARSWHWVDPESAIEKLTQIVVPGGHVALLTHEASWSLFAHEPVKSVVEKYVRRDDTPRRRPTDDRTVGLFTDAGFEVRVEEFPTTTVVDVEEWLDAMFTYSRFLVLTPEQKTQLRVDLAEAVGTGPITVEGTPRAVIARRTR